MCLKLMTNALTHSLEAVLHSKCRSMIRDNLVGTGIKLMVYDKQLLLQFHCEQSMELVL